MAEVVNNSLLSNNEKLVLLLQTELDSRGNYYKISVLNALASSGVEVQKLIQSIDALYQRGLIPLKSALRLINALLERELKFNSLAKYVDASLVDKLRQEYRNSLDIFITELMALASNTISFDRFYKDYHIQSRQYTSRLMEIMKEQESLRRINNVG